MIGEFGMFLITNKSFKSTKKKEGRKKETSDNLSCLCFVFAVELPISCSTIQMNFENPLRSDSPKCRNDKRLWP